jgi:hypothetical protein
VLRCIADHPAARLYKLLVALAITREKSRCRVSAFADPRGSGMITLDQQAETTMIDRQVAVEGVALDALDAFLSSDRSPPDSAALIFDSGPRVIAKMPLDDPETASTPTGASSAQNRSWRTRPCATPWPL